MGKHNVLNLNNVWMAKQPKEIDFSQNVSGIRYMFKYIIIQNTHLQIYQRVVLSVLQSKSLFYPKGPTKAYCSMTIH